MAETAGGSYGEFMLAFLALAAVLGTCVAGVPDGELIRAAFADALTAESPCAAAPEGRTICFFRDGTGLYGPAAAEPAERCAGVDAALLAPAERRFVRDLRGAVPAGADPDEPFLLERRLAAAEKFRLYGLFLARRAAASVFVLRAGAAAALCFLFQALARRRRNARAGISPGPAANRFARLALLAATGLAAGVFLYICPDAPAHELALAGTALLWGLALRNFVVKLPDAGRRLADDFGG